MLTTVLHENQKYQADLSKPIDLSIPIGDVKCFYAPDVSMQPFQEGDFVGSVKAGAPVNFFNVQMNPHGNGTHTECQGHITAEQESILDSLKNFHFVAHLITVEPNKRNDGDLVIEKEDVDAAIDSFSEALIIRTLPNDSGKKTRDYSGTNPPYLSSEAMEYLVENNVRHLLLDLPSVDRERDEGKLAAHHIFWNLGQTTDSGDRKDCTITELVHADSDVEDGLYLLNLQVISLRLDASPSKPVIYKLEADAK